MHKRGVRPEQAADHERIKRASSRRVYSARAVPGLGGSTMRARWIAPALMLASVARGQPPVEVGRVAIDDDSGRALAALHGALERARDGGRARITIWGASHVASDQYPGMLRTALQRRYGDGGPGLVLPASPFSLYAHTDVRVARAGAWRALRVRGSRR